MITLIGFSLIDQENCLRSSARDGWTNALNTYFAS